MPVLGRLGRTAGHGSGKGLGLGQATGRARELRRPPYAKHLDDGIFELRLSLRAGEHRSFFFYCRGDRLIFTHGYLKKTDKTSPAEIVRARRMRDYYENCEPPPHTGIK
jgi:phage-related protein